MTKIQQEQSIPQTSQLPKQVLTIDRILQIKNFGSLKTFLAKKVMEFQGGSIKRTTFRKSLPISCKNKIHQKISLGKFCLQYLSRKLSDGKFFSILNLKKLNKIVEYKELKMETVVSM